MFIKIGKNEKENATENRIKIKKVNFKETKSG